MTREEFFDALETGAKWDIGVAINRTNPVPIDANSVFESLEALETYAETNPVAHPGQLVAVVGETEVAGYIITSVGSGAVVQKLAASSASGDITQDVANLQTSVANIINGTQVVGKATADAAGNVIADTYATKAVATDAADGLMSSEDKAKLNGIAEGAQANVIEGVAVQTTTGGGYSDLEIVAKKVQLDLSNYATKQDLTAIPKFGIEVVDTLPTEDISTTTIYLVLQEEGEQAGTDIYDEYIYVNNTWELIGNTDIDLSAYSTTEQMNAAISTAIEALDFAELSVGAAKTIGVISQTNGVLAATAVDIAIPHTAVTDWDVELAKKQDAISVEGEGFLKKTAEGWEVDTSDYQTSAEVDSQIDSKIAGLDLANTYLGKGDKAVSAGTADKVANALTIGATVFDGSGAEEVTASDIAGLVTGYTGEETAVQADETGKLFVAVPDAPVYTGDDGVLVSGTVVSLADGGVTTEKIADGAVTNEKIASMDIMKLTQNEGDVLILDGGKASA